MDRFADFSSCGSFRYSLTRTWNYLLPRMLFVTLTPGMADGEQDDSMVRKCIGFAHRNGHGGFELVSLFAHRVKRVEDLAADGFKVGEHNDAAIIVAARNTETIVCAWGANVRKGPCRDRAAEVVRLLRDVRPDLELQALHSMVDGTPSNPLLINYKTSRLHPAELTWVKS
jgi:hypothetical protein